MCSSSRAALIGGARIEHGLDDRHIAGAAAEVSREHFAHPIGVAFRLFAEQRMCRRDHAGRTEAALESMMLAEARLQRREALIIRQPFNSDDSAALGLDGQDQTAADSL